MNQRAVIMTIVLFLLIVVGMFVFAYLNKQETETTIEEGSLNTPEEPTENRFGYIDRITAKHYYIDGEHTLVGEIPMPTPCDLLESEAQVRESLPEQIHINFTVINNAEVCAEVITPARFQVSASASPEATFSASLEGREIPLNLLEAGPDERPEDFELFIKG